MSNKLPGEDTIKRNAGRHLSNVWLNLLRMEFLLTGFFLCWNALFTIEIRTNYILHITMAGIRRRLLAEGIFLLLIGIVILAIPKVSIFLRNNKICAYLIPMHMWLILVVLGMEVVLRITIYNPPFASVRTTWFGSVPPQGSFTLWGTEGYAITRFDGKIPGEIQTPFQGGENILVLGDSFTEALQVPNNQKYPSIAEIILHQNGYRFDLHNLGHSGRTMADYVGKMKNYQTLYNPKVIVIQLAENDFIESFDMGKPDYFIAENSKIVDIVRTGKFKGKFLVKNIMSSNLTFSLLEHAKGRLSILMKDWKDPTVQIYESPASQAFDVGLAKQQMDLLIEASNGKPIIVIINPHAPYISENHVELNDPQHQNLKIFLSNYPQIILVDPLPEFQQLALSGNLPMGFSNSTQPGEGHLNRKGHEILGKLLAQTIEAVVK